MISEDTFSQVFLEGDEATLPILLTQWRKAYLYIPAFTVDQDSGMALGITFDLGECFLDLSLSIGQHFIALLISNGAIPESTTLYDHEVVDHETVLEVVVVEGLDLGEYLHIDSYRQAG